MLCSWNVGYVLRIQGFFSPNSRPSMKTRLRSVDWPFLLPLPHTYLVNEIKSRWKIIQVVWCKYIRYVTWPTNCEVCIFAISKQQRLQGKRPYSTKTFMIVFLFNSLLNCTTNSILEFNYTFLETRLTTKKWLIYYFNLFSLKQVCRLLHF